MVHITLAALAAWQNFYVIVGSSAGTMTALQFVVITLITQARAAGSSQNIRAFGTPTVIHFCTALLISAGMVAPWNTIDVLANCLVAFALAGTAYALRIVWHARKADYRPDAEDWIWYVGLPFVAHVALLVAAALIRAKIPWYLALVAVDALVFLLLGVRNAWDTVTYIAVSHALKREAAGDDSIERRKP